MKIGALCEVIAIASHFPSQFGDLIVVCDIRNTRTGGRVVTGINLKTGKQHHYFTKEIEEVKQ
tara:strand:+ start:4358 stop:4546 length:189 start_codon:yes stop_codon:yes gene_type:complete